jgi:hypothetical protein
MNRILGLALAAVVAALTGVAVYLTGPAAADPNAAAAAVADAYLGAPPAERLRVGMAALPAGARGVIVVMKPTADQFANPVDERLALAPLQIGGKALAGLAATGPIGVADRGDVVAYVAAPAGGVIPVLPALLAALGAVIAAGLAWMGGSRRPVVRPGATAEAATAGPDAREVTAQRASLVSTLVELVEQAPPGLTQRITSALAAVGVTAQSLDGQPFDPTWQTAVGSEPAPTPLHAQLVARTERPLFVDNGRRLNRPLVVVYTAGAGPEPGASR